MLSKYAHYVLIFVRLVPMNAASIRKSIAKDVLKHVGNVQKNVGKWLLKLLFFFCDKYAKT